MVSCPDSLWLFIGYYEILLMVTIVTCGAMATNSMACYCSGH